MIKIMNNTILLKILKKYINSGMWGAPYVGGPGPYPKNGTGYKGLPK